ncbi:ligand-binding sensor domain-containing protein [Galbibacter mesophilus]|uniref:ligand-binding sensor domain-containing protein n=1 Tax=Galbibacter mesophilus TaxID=379069 RepID=UPI00191DB07C|nr:two-component regulator propeller domain-containing protein [Galbibacter mesophilus]MCM5662332.1 hypothetical protein [Galbibacter mesophilus]
MLFCASVFYGKAQLIPSDTISVKTIAQEDGLSQLNALTLDFDRLGYLWIGTENGLNRYNGHQMTVFKTGTKPHQLKDDHIRAMYHSNDTLWLATNTHSICAYVQKRNKFLSFEDKLDFNKFPSLKFAYTLTPINERYLLAGTIDYCVLIDRKTLEFEVFPINSGVDNEYITSIIPFKNGSFLLSTNYKRTYVFNFSEKCLSPFVAKPKGVQALIKLDEERILIGTEKGLFVYDLIEGVLKELPSAIGKKNISGFFRWDDKNILVSAANHNYLINRNFQCKELIFIGHKGSAMQTTICSLSKDNQGGIWMGTKGRGVFYYHPEQQKFTPHRISVSNAPKKDFISIFNFLKEGDTLWMATEFGLARHQKSTDQYKLYLTNNLDYTLAKDARGTLWAGGFGDGLLRYNRKSDIFENVTLPISDKDVIQITPVSKDSIWIHTWSEGIYAMNIHNQKLTKKVFNGTSLIRSRNSLVDSNGDVWLASDNGLYQVNKDETEYYSSLSNERVFCIAEDLNGNIWAGTAKGLNKINTETGEITYYKQQEGLPNDFIYGLEVDKKNNIWVSTNYGLSQLDTQTETFTNYTEQDGLQNNEFNGKASYKDNYGNLYFGGMNGYNIINIDSIAMNDVAGNTIVEDIQLFGKSIDANVVYNKSLDLSYEEDVITFNFVNLNYLWPEKNHFRFMLKGFDKDWRPVTQQHSSTYTNLNPGTYTFKVQGANNEMLWGNTDSFRINIKAPWYQTLWFKILMAFSFFVILAGAVHFRHKRQIKVNRMLSEMVEERTNKLVKTNIALKDSLEVTRKQKKNISYLMQELNHRVKNNLQLMTSLIDFQSINSRDELQSSQLKQLQSRIFTLAKIHDSLSQQKEISKNVRLDKFIHQLTLDIISFSGFYIKLETEFIPMVFPNDKLTYVGLVLNELITNSIKHAFEDTKDTPIISLFLKNQDDQLVFEYRDNGKGCSKEDIDTSESMGFKLIELLIDELGMEFIVKTTKGSHFVFVEKGKESSIRNYETTSKNFG